MRGDLRWAIGAAALLLAACGPSDRDSAVTPVPASTALKSAAPQSAPTPLSPRAQLGRQLFFDQKLSASGHQSCATCHDPAHAYAPANNLPVQLGGADLRTAGTRAVPSLMYKNYTHAYSDQFQNPDNVSPPGPGGGFAWDGRANSLAEQAAIPLLASNEMANPSRAVLVGKVAKASYAQQFREVFGPGIFRNPHQAFMDIGLALQAFQIEDPSFHPYNSKFDRYRNNKLGGELTATEQRGLALYLSPDKGNCNACHLLGPGNDGSQDISSDYSFAAIGVPRNRDIPANADPAYFDLGLCGPLRKDHQPSARNSANQYCGMFKAPILRNASTRQVFMHNGYFKSLRDVLKFYATRDTAPQDWYPRDANGLVMKFDDLPKIYQDNLDRQLPLDQRSAGSVAALSQNEIKDLLAFLETLTDDAFVRR